MNKKILLYIVLALVVLGAVQAVRFELAKECADCVVPADGETPGKTNTTRSIDSSRTPSI